MKTVISLALLSAFCLLTSCATIVGGGNYYAHVKVPDHPNAKIEYKGQYKGTGEATIKTSRRLANKFSVTVKEDGYEDQTFNFSKRAFRGWAFAGTVIGWTGMYSGIPIPWGVAVDVVSGALWKPSLKEKGVTKTDMKNYNYVLDYGPAPSASK